MSTQDIKGRVAEHLHQGRRPCVTAAEDPRGHTARFDGWLEACGLRWRGSLCPDVEVFHVRQISAARGQHFAKE
jgi:hypothetical protein